jgi:hypothetical protein
MLKGTTDMKRRRNSYFSEIDGAIEMNKDSEGGIKIPPPRRRRRIGCSSRNPRTQKGRGSQVAIAVRFGVPIFVNLKEEPKGELERGAFKTVKALVKIREPAFHHRRGI